MRYRLQPQTRIVASRRHYCKTAENADENGVFRKRLQKWASLKTLRF